MRKVIYLLYCIRNIRVSKGKVLECTSKTMIECRIENKGAGGGTQLSLGVSRPATWVAR